MLRSLLPGASLLAALTRTLMALLLLIIGLTAGAAREVKARCIVQLVSPDGLLRAFGIATFRRHRSGCH